MSRDGFVLKGSYSAYCIGYPFVHMERREKAEKHTLELKFLCECFSSIKRAAASNIAVLSDYATIISHQVPN